jgi:hypothetical protein
MDELRNALNERIRGEVDADPMAALRTINAVQGDLTEHQDRAVRAAAQAHSWAAIGEALGISRQAAHEKFAKRWAQGIKRDVKDPEKRDAALAEAKAMRRANKRKRS